MKRIALFFAAVSWSLGCATHQGPLEADVVTTANDAALIGDAFHQALSHRPRSPNFAPPKVTETTSGWKLTYEPNENAFGWTIELEIDRRTGALLSYRKY